MDMYNLPFGEPKVYFMNHPYNHFVQNRKQTDKNKSLCDAINEGNLQKVKEHLKNGAYVNFRNFGSQSPLEVALSSKARSLQIVQELLGRGAYPNVTDNNGNTPLHRVSEWFMTVEYVQLLLKHKANVHIKNYEFETALHTIIWTKTDAKIVREILLHGADPNARDEEGNTPLHLCFKVGITEECFAEMLRCKTVSVTNVSGVYPLYKAAESCFPLLQTVAELLAHGADMNMVNHEGILAFCGAMEHVPLAQLVIRYTLLHTFQGESRNIFKLSRYRYRYSTNYSTVARYFKDCVSELRKMKAMKIDHLSLHSFATTENSTTVLYSENENAKFFTQEQKLIANYPIYSDLIRLKVKYSLERGMLLRKLEESCIYSRNCDLVKNH